MLSRICFLEISFHLLIKSIFSNTAFYHLQNKTQYAYICGRSISFYVPSILYKNSNLSEIEGHRRKNIYFSDQIKSFYIKGKSFYQDKLLYVLPSIIICTSFYFSKMSLSHSQINQTSK